ncbi:PspC domain-containing protein [Raoultibacter phocaeensis]|uniref:PspC domain-containing protein n=1 Tax=Raoultibacter phocaeensis TaxID=2479841 RepID=UPI001118F7AA|nr:PspC domain-containing protein [Raoultibacter phocaeensis]
MAADKRLYRSRDALIGGVCAGIAEYFDIDPIVARILAVVLTLATAGTFAIAYLALWIILPLAPDPTAPVEVKPESVHSETYGPVYYEAPPATEQAASHAPTEKGPYYTYPDATHSYPTSGHVPPEPPTSYGEAHVPPQAAGQVQPAPPAEPVSGKSVRVALWFGFICLFIGFSALLGHFIQDVSWWQFWPVLFVIVGIGNIVIPAQKGKRMSQFVNGIMEIAVGAVLLCMSLGVVTFSSVIPMVENLWPLLVMMVGFFILSNALKSPLLELIGGACFVAFCVIGLVWFTTPGPTEFLTVEIPFKETVVIDINPWDERR